MNKKTTYKLSPDMIPAVIVYPGEILLDELNAREIKQKELAASIGIAANVMNEIIKGKRNITAILAYKLELALGINAEFWLKLQAQYELELLRTKYKYEPVKPLSKMYIHKHQHSQIGLR